MRGATDDSRRDVGILSKSAAPDLVMSSKPEPTDADWPGKPVRAACLTEAEIAFARALVRREGEAAVLARSDLGERAFERGLAGLGMYRGNRVAWRVFLEREGYGK